MSASTIFSRTLQNKSQWGWCQRFYRGSVHSLSYLNYKLQIAFIYHKLNCDSNPFIKTLVKNKEHIFVLAQNKDKYISFTKQLPAEYNIKENKRNFFV